MKLSAWGAQSLFSIALPCDHRVDWRRLRLEGLRKCWEPQQWDPEVCKEGRWIRGRFRLQNWQGLSVEFYINLSENVSQCSPCAMWNFFHNYMLHIAIGIWKLFNLYTTIFSTEKYLNMWEHQHSSCNMSLLYIEEAKYSQTQFIN